MVELFPGDPFPDYPVTTLSLGTGLTWQHRACDELRCLRERLSVSRQGQFIQKRALLPFLPPNLPMHCGQREMSRPVRAQDFLGGGFKPLERSG
jgi:hypothetical protein